MLLAAAYIFPFFGFGLLFPLAMYFLPTIIAVARNKRDTTAIFLLNFFLGWSIVGWFVALIWAVKHDVPVVAR
jgi:Superinfection immunity protein